MVILLYSVHLDIPGHYCRSLVILKFSVIPFYFHECLKLQCNSSPFEMWLSFYHHLLSMPSSEYK